ncbi:MAG: outer membrane lipoprotein carrier protein LolA [Candidatus Acidiferrum sp.]
MKRAATLCAGFFLAFLVGNGVFAGDELSQYIAKFQNRYQLSRTSSATFLELYSENGQLVRSEAGTAYFQRPSRMRWEYDAPEKNLFLVDGKSAWFYVPADHTVTKVPAKHSADWRTPLALLAGDVKVSRVCSHVSLASSERSLLSGDVMLACQLRGQDPGNAAEQMADGQPATAKDAAVLLELAPQSGELLRVLVGGKGGVSIEFRFKNWNFDAPIPSTQFQFHPPPGVVILNGELPLQKDPVK